MRNGAERHEEERLSALLDDELSEEDALEVTRHLSGCERCLAELEEIRAARVALRSLPTVELPAVLLHGVPLTAAQAAARWRRTLRRGMTAAAAVGAVMGTVFVAGAEERGTVVPPVDIFVVDHVARVGGGPVVTPVDLGRPGP